MNQKIILKNILEFALIPALVFSILGAMVFRILLHPIWFLQLFLFGFFFFIFLLLSSIIFVVKHKTKNDNHPLFLSAVFYILLGILAIFIPFVLFAVLLGLSGGT